MRPDLERIFGLNAIEGKQVVQVRNFRLITRISCDTTLSEGCLDDEVISPIALTVFGGSYVDKIHGARGPRTVGPIAGFLRIARVGTDAAWDALRYRYR